jgi:hypothetical protein
VLCQFRARQCSSAYIRFITGYHPGHEVDHTHPFSVEVKNKWGYTSTPPPHYAFKAWAVTTLPLLYYTHWTLCMSLDALYAIYRVVKETKYTNTCYIWVFSFGERLQWKLHEIVG